jgi:uroporphyrinogen decarboxylase
LLTINARAVADYLAAQIEAGAQAVMIFDTWGGALADGAFQAFSLNYTAQVLERLKAHSAGVNQSKQVPTIVFTKGGGVWLSQIADIGSDGVGLDWTMNLGQARAMVGDRVALQGNLDPIVLMADAEQVRAETIKVLDSFGAPQAGAGHIFNLGHGISQFTPPDNVAVLVDTVHSHSRAQKTAR